MDDIRWKKTTFDANMEPDSAMDETNFEEEGNENVDLEASKSVETPLNQMIAQDVLRMEFASLSEAESFYYRYAKMVGFEVRRDHVGRNKNGDAQTNVGRSNFTHDFVRLIVETDVEVEFEDQWASLVRKYNLQNDAWVNEIYQRKHLWSSTCFRGKYFADLRTTECEGMNAYLDRFTELQYSLVEFLHRFHQSLKQYRHNEIDVDFKSNQEGFLH